MGFGHSLLFAVASAAGLPIVVWLTSPLLGTPGALAAYTSATVVAYLVAIAPNRRSGIGVAVLATALIGGLLILPLRLATLS